MRRPYFRRDLYSRSEPDLSKVKQNQTKQKRWNKMNGKENKRNTHNVLYENAFGDRSHDTLTNAWFIANSWWWIENAVSVIIRSTNIWISFLVFQIFLNNLNAWIVYKMCFDCGKRRSFECTFSCFIVTINVFVRFSMGLGSAISRLFGCVFQLKMTNNKRKYECSSWIWMRKRKICRYSQHLTFEFLAHCFPYSCHDQLSHFSSEHPSEQNERIDICDLCVCYWVEQSRKPFLFGFSLAMHRIHFLRHHF